MERKIIMRLLKTKIRADLCVHLFLILLLFLACFLGMSALQIFDSISSERRRVYDEMGGRIDISFDEDFVQENYSEADMLEYLNGNELITGINFSVNADWVIAENFQNSKRYTGTDPYTQINEDSIEGLTDNSVVIQGNTNTLLSDEYNEFECRLVTGELPGANNRGAIISEELADASNINVGDELTVKEIINGAAKLYSFDVVGIYHTNSGFSVTEDNTFGSAVFAFSPYNYIYVDWTTIGEFKDISTGNFNYEIFYDNYLQYEKILSAITESPVSQDEITIWDFTGSTESQAISQIEAMKNISYLILGCISIISVILIVLCLAIYNKEYQKDSAVLYLIGCKEIGRRLFRGVPCLIGFAFCGVIGFILSRIIQMNVLQYLYSYTYHEDKSVVSAYDRGASYILGMPNISDNICLIICTFTVIMILCLGFVSLKKSNVEKGM